MNIEISHIQKKVRLNSSTTHYPFGFNVCGYLSKDFGLGFAARNTVKLLQDNLFPVSVYDISIPDFSGPQTSCCESLKTDQDNPFPYLITIFHVNPSLLPRLSQYYEPYSSTHINLFVPFWELDQIPLFWVNMCGFIDLFLAPSRFIEKGLQRLFSGRVLYYQQPYQLPSEIKPDREKYNIPAETTVFFQSFDIASDLVRKNPIATINAFHKAFKNDHNALLILNVNVTNNNETVVNAISKLKSLVSSVSNILIFDRKQDYTEVLTLYASSDVLVSLHRAEGLGLSLIEAMVMGKAIITTAYSGNMDFINTENSCLVPFNLIPAVSPFNPNLSKDLLGFDPFWADPDIDQAAKWMRILSDDRNLRNSIQEKAKKSIHSFLECSNKATVFFFLKEIMNN